MIAGNILTQANPNPRFWGGLGWTTCSPTIWFAKIGTVDPRMDGLGLGSGKIRGKCRGGTSLAKKKEVSQEGENTTTSDPETYPKGKLPWVLGWLGAQTKEKKKTPGNDRSRPFTRRVIMESEPPPWTHGHIQSDQTCSMQRDTQHTHTV